MSDEQDKLKLSLEPPRFGRKKKAGKADSAKAGAKATPARKQPATKKTVAKKTTAAPVTEKTPEKKRSTAVDAPAPAVEEPQATRPEATTPTAEEPVETTPVARTAATAGAVADEPVPVDEPEPVAEEPSAEPEDAEPATATTDTTAVLPAVEEPERIDDDPEPVATDADPIDDEPKPVAQEPESVAAEAEPVVQQPPGDDVATAPADDTDIDEPTSIFDADREDAEIAAMVASSEDDEPANGEADDAEPVTVKKVREPRVPRLTLYPAGAVTGLVVGATMVLLTWLSLRGCEAVRGTSSCGGGPGFILLVATFVLCVLLGRALLKAFEASDPGSSSFLAVGLVAAIALFFLIDFLDEWPMIVVIPLLSVAGFLASVWVTKTFVEPADT